MIAQISVLALDILLLATLIYLGVLTRRLKAFQSYKNDMRSIVDDVLMATESARNAVAKLKTAVSESHTSMTQHFENARKVEMTIDARIASATRILTDLQKAESNLERRSQAMREAVNSVAASKAKQGQDIPDGMDGSVAAAFSKLRSGSSADDFVDADLSQRLNSISDAVSKLRTKITANS